MSPAGAHSRARALLRGAAAARIEARRSCLSREDAATAAPRRSENK